MGVTRLVTVPVLDGGLLTVGVAATGAAVAGPIGTVTEVAMVALWPSLMVTLKVSLSCRLKLDTQFEIRRSFAKFGAARQRGGALRCTQLTAVTLLPPRLFA